MSSNEEKAIHVLEQLNEQLLCPVCLEKYCDPKLLNCHHTFCANCLLRIINNCASPFVTCPSCRHETQIPDGGIANLPTNFFVNSMLTYLSLEGDQLQKAYKERKCETCDEPEFADFATSKCVDCSKVLCGGCVADHKRARATLDHRVVAIPGSDSECDKQELDRYSTSFCKTHTRNIIKYYCITCDTTVCRVCTILEHREHKYVYPKEALPEQKEEIAKLLGKTKEQIPQIKGALALVQEMSKKLGDCKKTIAAEIKMNTEERVTALMKAEENLLARLEFIYTGKQKVLGLQRDGLELELGKISGCCEFAENVLKYENEVEILTIKNKLKSLNDVKMKFDPEEDDTIQYCADADSLNTVVRSLGTLHASSTFASLSYAVGDGLSTARVKVEASFQVITKDRHGDRKEGGDRINVLIYQPDGVNLKTKIKDEGDGTYNVSFTPEMNGKHRISVTIQDKPIKDSPFTVLVINRREYNEVGSTLMRFGQYGSKKREFKSPFGVACDQSGHIYVADSYNHRIQVFGTKGEFVHFFGAHGERKGEFNCPTDVAVDSESRVIVCDNGNNRIQVLTQNGAFIAKFGREGTGNGQFKSPWGVAVTEARHILVADMENHRIQMFSPEGKFTMKFGSFGEKSGQLNSPCYVLVEKESENIIVADSKNHRLQFFDKNGRFRRKLGSQGSRELQFTHPRGLALDICGHLVVADMGNHRLQIVTLDGKLVKTIGSEGSGDGQLSFPESVAVTPNTGYIVVSDLSNNRIQVF